MSIIKLDAIGSTNDYLKDLVQKKQLSDYTVVSAQHQTKGKGQRNKAWMSEAGKNLTVSILKLHSGKKSAEQFRISIHAALAIIDVLEQCGIPDLALKWPNDIMSGGAKICGILIENSLRGLELVHSVIGIGLNVNQETFTDLPNASSMKKITGEFVDVDELVIDLIDSFKKEFKLNEILSWDKLKERYEAKMYQKENWVSFSDNEGDIKGLITGILPSGQLNITLENGTMRSIQQGELQWVL
ncbi:MAG: biotin--[acetyl-CoA-carboxylase] ligase [Flavobacteriaceae bacterium]|nr:biotin--[acetyl-CoA-carboxylase] ligase [Flavobacteriaceae bacterium]